MITNSFCFNYYFLLNNNLYKIITTRFDLCYNIKQKLVIIPWAGDTTRFDLCYNIFMWLISNPHAGDTTRFDLCYNSVVVFRLTEMLGILLALIYATIRYKINYLIY